MKIEDMIKANRADCVGCSACMNACRFNCIAMTSDSEGFLYPQINHDACKQCGRCDNACPVLNTATAIENKPGTWAAVNPNEFDRKRSSSGGVFYALAKSIINQGGVVFGATFNHDWEVVHNCAEDIHGVRQFQGSKYVQSRIGDMYQRVEEFLKHGRKVLFTGTPCQVAGLKSFLNRDDDNLLSVDLVCHGVPSPAVWKAYVEAQKNIGGEIHHISFRRKIPSWRVSSLEIVFKHSPKYIYNLSEDYYMKCFLNNLCLRPSCHACKFRPNGHQHSDITLGDFWGIENCLPQMDDNRGTSVVLLHSIKGIDALKKLNLYLAKSDFNDAARSNPNLMSSVAMPSKRADFFRDLAQGMNILTLLERYVVTNQGMRVGLENILPFYGKKHPLFFGDPAYANHVKNLFKLADGDYIELVYSNNVIDLTGVINGIRPYAIHIFFTNVYHELKSILEQRGLREHEDFVDGRYLFSALP